MTHLRWCHLHMHNWAPVPHAHAHLGAGAPAHAHLDRAPCAHAHLGASAPCTSTLCSCISRDGLHYCVEGCFRLGKKGQSMPRHMAASSHKQSATIIGVDFITFVGHVPLFQGRHMAQKNGGCMPNGCGRMLAVACSHMSRQ